MKKNWSLQKHIWAREDLDHYEKAVCLCLIWHRNSATGLCYPSITTIAQETSISRRKVISTLQSLRDKQVVDYQGQPNKKNSYDLVHTVHHPSAHRAPEPLIQTVREEKDTKTEERCNVIPLGRYTAIALANWKNSNRKYHGNNQ